MKIRISILVVVAAIGGAIIAAGCSSGGSGTGAPGETIIETVTVEAPLACPSSGVDIEKLVGYLPLNCALVASVDPRLMNEQFVNNISDALTIDENLRGIAVDVAKSLDQFSFCIMTDADDKKHEFVSSYVMIGKIMEGKTTTGLVNELKAKYASVITRDFSSYVGTGIVDLDRKNSIFITEDFVVQGSPESVEYVKGVYDSKVVPPVSARFKDLLAMSGAGTIKAALSLDSSDTAQVPSDYMDKFKEILGKLFVTVPVSTKFVAGLDLGKECVEMVSMVDNAEVLRMRANVKKSFLNNLKQDKSESDSDSGGDEGGEQFCGVQSGLACRGSLLTMAANGTESCLGFKAKSGDLCGNHYMRLKVVSEDPSKVDGYREDYYYHQCYNDSIYCNYLGYRDSGYCVVAP